MSIRKIKNQKEAGNIKKKNQKEAGNIKKRLICHSVHGFHRGKMCFKSSSQVHGHHKRYHTGVLLTHNNVLKLLLVTHKNVFLLTTQTLKAQRNGFDY